MPEGRVTARDNHAQTSQTEGQQRRFAHAHEEGYRQIYPLHVRGYRTTQMQSEGISDESSALTHIWRGKRQSARAEDWGQKSTNTEVPCLCRHLVVHAVPSYKFVMAGT